MVNRNASQWLIYLSAQSSRKGTGGIIGSSVALLEEVRHQGDGTLGFQTQARPGVSFFLVSAGPDGERTATSPVTCVLPVIMLPTIMTLL